MLLNECGVSVDSNGNGKMGGGVGVGGAFMRGEKSSVSVRLRSKKCSDSSAAAAQGKKRNRHSGDFGFFAAASPSRSKSPHTHCQQQQQQQEDRKKGADWAYITFPNGVPTVQDIQTQVGPLGSTKVAGSAAAILSTPGSRASLCIETSASLHGPCSPSPPVPDSSGSSSSSSKSMLKSVILRTANCQQSAASSLNKSPVPGADRDRPSVRNSCILEEHMLHKSMANEADMMRHVTQVSVPGGSSMPNTDPKARNPVIFRRKNGPSITGTGGAYCGGVAKRCSGEFDYIKHNHRRSGDYTSSLLLLDSPQVNNGPDEVVRLKISGPSSHEASSPDLVLRHDQSHHHPQQQQQQQQQQPSGGAEPVRKPGLGRRAVTQIHIKHVKKDSYNSAMAKSQENLVKLQASAMSGNSQDYDDDDDADLRHPNQVDSSLEKKSSTTIKKGLLWQQRDKFFSQWKERYFILTTDYLQCFKRGTSRITEMGEFIYKIKLSELESVELLDRRGYLVICISLQKEGKVYLRKTEGIRDWFNLLKESAEESRKRRDDRNSKGFWATKQLTDSSSIEKWLQARKKIGLQYSYLNGDNGVAKVQQNNVTAQIKGASESPEIGAPKPSPPQPQPRSEITLDELSDLYRCEEEEERRKEEERRRSVAILHSPISETPVTHRQLSSAHCRMSSSRDDLRNSQISAKITKKINRLSLISDLDLPDTDLLGIDLDKGIFIRNRQRNHLIDNDSNDSGNNSMNTNGSVGSSNSSHSNHSNPRETRERLETHVEDQMDDDNGILDDPGRLKGHFRHCGNSDKDDLRRQKILVNGGRRSSSHIMPNGLQVTHV